jgi:hypothetical protein
LRELYAGSLLLKEIPVIPQKLRKIGIRIRPAKDTPPVEENPEVYVCDMARLPSTLMEIDLSVAPDGAKYSKFDLGFLPRNLNTLALSLDNIQDVDTLLAIPRLLESLTIRMEDDCDLGQNLRLLEYLPTGLSFFTLDTNHAKVVWQDWMHTIANWSKLETLYIFTSLMSSVNMDILFNLPKSVKEVILPVCKSEIRPEHLKRLPRGMSVLVLQSVYGDISPFYASDECFSNLPASLFQLHLPPQTQGLTSKLSGVLPDSLIQISGPPLFETLKLELSKRKWEGFDYVDRF